MTDKKMWSWEIRPHSTWVGTNFKELFAYKDLLFRLVRKEFLIRYQQTLLGPVWVLIQPVLTVIVYVLIFNRIIKVPISNNVPPPLFYLAGITLWSLFSDIFSGTANTFLQNINVFNKVYFPRLIAPLSITFLHLIRFLIQLVLLMLMIFYYYITGQVVLNGFTFLLILPITLFTAAFGLGCGLIFSIITARYRDLSNILSLIISLLMFVTPIFFSLEIVPENIQWLVNLNPLSTFFELFRYAVLGIGHVALPQILYGAFAAIFSFFAGLLFFNKNEGKLIDII